MRNFLRRKYAKVSLSVLAGAVVLGLVSFAPSQALASNTHSFDVEAGSSQYASVANDLGIAGGNITIEAWYKPESHPTTGVRYAIASQSDAGNDVFYAIYYRNDGGTLKLSASRAKQAVVENFADYTITLDTNTWYHLVLTYDGTNVKLSTATAFGVHFERASAASSGNGSSGQIDTTMVGAAYDGAVNYYADGLIDDVRFWNTVRTVTQMDDNFQTEVTGAEAGLAAYYKLNDGYSDSTSNGYNLTASGSPSFSSTDVPFTASAASQGVRKSATQTVTSDTTTDNDSELSISLFADREYVIDGVILASSTSGVPDIKTAFSAPSGAILDIAMIPSSMRDIELIQASDTDTDGIPIFANRPIAIQVVGTVKTGASGGTLNFQWAQNSSNGNATAVLRGSYLRADEI